MTPLWTSPGHPGPAHLAVSAATWVVTEHGAALGTQHRTGEVHAGTGTHVGRRERGTHHRGTCKRRRPLQIQGCHPPPGAEGAVGKQQPLGDGTPSAERWPGTVQTPTRTATRDTGTDTHRRTGFRHDADLRRGRQVPREGTEDGTPAPPPAASAAAAEPDGAELLERPVRLLPTRACSWRLGCPRDRRPVLGTALVSALAFTPSTRTHTHAHTHTHPFLPSSNDCRRCSRSFVGEER